MVIRQPSFLLRSQQVFIFFTLILNLITNKIIFCSIRKELLASQFAINMSFLFLLLILVCCCLNILFSANTLFSQKACILFHPKTVHSSSIYCGLYIHPFITTYNFSHRNFMYALEPYTCLSTHRRNLISNNTVSL